MTDKHATAEAAQKIATLFKAVEMFQETQTDVPPAIMRLAGAWARYGSGQGPRPDAAYGVNDERHDDAPAPARGLTDAIDNQSIAHGVKPHLVADTIELDLQRLGIDIPVVGDRLDSNGRDTLHIRWCEIIRMSAQAKAPDALHRAAWASMDTPASAAFRRPRPEVRAFARAMEERLAANDYKGGWQAEAADYFLKRINDELKELKAALDKASKDGKRGLARGRDAGSRRHRRLLHDGGRRLRTPQLQGPLTVPRGFIKLNDGQLDWYLEWSTVVDAPTTMGMSREALSKYVALRHGHEDLEAWWPQSLARIDQKGTSFMGDLTVEQTLKVNRAGANESCLSPQQIIHSYCHGNGIARDGRCLIKGRHTHTGPEGARAEQCDWTRDLLVTLARDAVPKKRGR